MLIPCVSYHKAIIQNLKSNLFGYEPPPSKGLPVGLLKTDVDKFEMGLLTNLVILRE